MPLPPLPHPLIIELRDCLDHDYMLPDSRARGIEFAQFAVIFTRTTFSMISCY